MKTLSLAMILICYSNIIFSQVQVHGKVIDAETNQTIPYVNIGIKNTAIGTVSNGDGEFELRLKDKGIITFSSIGYEDFNISQEDLSNPSVIKLIPKNYQIQEIEIVAQRFEGEDQMFGVKNKTRGLSIGFGSRNLGTEIGALIPIKGPTFIKSANFVLNHTQGDSLLFQVNIYSYLDGEVGENILKENILLRTEQRRGVISIDLTSLNLILDHDVLLALEWIRDDNEKGNTGITFDTKKSKKLKGVYVKTTSIGAFETMGYIKPKLKPCFYLIGKQLK